MGLWSDFKDWATGEDETEKATAQANKLLQQASELQTKSAEETMKEGRTAAGAAAADKAGQAKTQAKAASAMSGGSRLQNATAGAKAAGQAASEGYTDTANQIAQTQAQIDAQQVANKQNLLSQQAANIQQSGQEKAKRAAAGRQGVLSAVGSIFSDGRTKDIKKHTYLKQEDRIRR